MRKPLTPADILGGPRGRRLCLELLGVDAAHLDIGPPGPSAADLAAGLELVLAGVDLGPVAAHPHEVTLLGPLSRSVEAAVYWQDPDPWDRALTNPRISRILEPVAQALAASPSTAWWSAPVDPRRQQYIQWFAEAGPPPTLTGARRALRAWRAAAVREDLRARYRPADYTAPMSSSWWSAPRPTPLPSTTRSLPGLGAVGLALVEDSTYPRQARCWPLWPDLGCRIYEIHRPADWVSLTTRYPLDVTQSRRHDWWRATGWAGSWVIPDWAAVSAEYDGVHLSVAGYLSTAGRALAVGGSCTLLGGWNPDQTYWLADVLRPAGPATRWDGTPGRPADWTAAAPS